MIKQVQKGGDQSTNIQAGEVHIVGISYAEAHQIALDVFKTNFLSLSDRAAEIALARVEEITEKFLRKLKEQNEKGIAHAQDPDFQYALFTIQKEYAKTGNKELGDLLIDILVDRTKEESRSIMQIVLNESLSVAPKLTIDQLATLSIIFIFSYTVSHRINNLQTLKEYFDTYIAPLAGLISKKPPCYQHLEFAGCASISIGSRNLLDILFKNYAGVFSKGFQEAELKEINITIPIKSPMFIVCLHDDSKFQINAIKDDVLLEKAKGLNIDKEEVDKLVQLNKSVSMNGDEIKNYLEELCPYMKTVFDVWENSFMKNIRLTSVGIAIGHANVKRYLGEFTDLSIWIN
jgi:hypothetical protein